MPEQALVRWRVTVPAAEAEIALAELLGRFPGGMEEETDGALVHLSGFLPEGEAPDLGARFAPTAEAVEPGWREAWRAFHRPVRVGPLLIRAPWHPADASSEEIVIEPGLAFGTGAHGSTRSAVALLLRGGAGAGAIADVGCGSGVLAIVASRLGFDPVLAVDIDPNAVTATGENAARNGVTVAVWRADALRDPLPAAPLIVANLQLEILVPFFERDDLPPVVIVSGLLASEPFAPAGWAAIDGETCDGWQAIRLERVP